MSSRIIVKAAALSVIAAGTAWAQGDETAEVDIEVELRRAESQLAAAANRVAELSMQRLPELAVGGLAGVTHGRPMLGITLANGNPGVPVDGVEIVGITPGGPADEAGLRAGDMILGIDGVSLAADQARHANEQLLAVLSESGAGNAVALEYSRDGKSATAKVVPRAFQNHTISIRGLAPPPGFAAAGAPHAAMAVPASRFVFMSGAGGLGDMEMVSLTPGLGEYFGTPEGMLVVRAPEESAIYKLEDGDVILDIDGRQPKSVPHAVRILSTYQSGETLKLRIMRKERERTLEIDVPDRTPGIVALPAPVRLQESGESPLDRE